MSEFPRYAIYYVPDADHPLYRFGAESIGYDAFSLEPVPFPQQLTAVAPDWNHITSDPRKYGFHATLKAPFALAPDCKEDDLLAACASFAATPRALPTITPIVDQISGFIAVVPSERSEPLVALARDCVMAFDRFRAPLTDADRARRKPDRLTPIQRDHLERWGYPYVMDDFRFHMTLTGRLSDDRRGPDHRGVESALLNARSLDPAHRPNRRVQAGRQAITVQNRPPSRAGKRMTNSG